MKKNARFFIRVTIVLLLAVILVSLYWYAIKPKYLYGDGFPTTATYRGFYDEKRNSIDVLFLGSSHGVCAFDPEVFDGATGLRSYNLSCEQQNLFTSYYWLKEALKYQKPGAVVLDCFMLYHFENEALAPTIGNCTRKAFDFMRPSFNKLSAYCKANEISEELTFTSLAFPNVMYHDRWKELSSRDVSFNYLTDADFLRGYYRLEDAAGLEYSPIESLNAEFEIPNEIMYNYLQKIVDLCRKEGIRLILVSTPTTFENEGMLSWMLNESECTFSVEMIDFNKASIYEECGYDFSKDNYDDDHANVYGAEKITNYLGQILKDEN